MKRENDKRPSIIDNLFEKPTCKRYVILNFLFFKKFHRILYEQVYHEKRNISSPNSSGRINIGPQRLRVDQFFIVLV